MWELVSSPHLLHEHCDLRTLGFASLGTLSKIALLATLGPRGPSGSHDSRVHCVPTVVWTSLQQKACRRAGKRPGCWGARNLTSVWSDQTASRTSQLTLPDHHWSPRQIVQKHDSHVPTAALCWRLHLPNYSLHASV